MADFQGVLNVYSKLQKIPANFSEMGNMLVNLIENLKKVLLSKFMNYNAMFLAGFPKQIADTFRLKNMNRSGGQINRLIKMENLDLIVSPSKLFEGTNVPRTSD